MPDRVNQPIEGENLKGKTASRDQFVFLEVPQVDKPSSQDFGAERPEGALEIPWKYDDCDNYVEENCHLDDFDVVYDPYQDDDPMPWG